MPVVISIKRFSSMSKPSIPIPSDSTNNKMDSSHYTRKCSEGVLSWSHHVESKISRRRKTCELFVGAAECLLSFTIARPKCQQEYLLSHYIRFVFDHYDRWWQTATLPNKSGEFHPVSMATYLVEPGRNCDYTNFSTRIWVSVIEHWKCDFKSWSQGNLNLTEPRLSSSNKFVVRL